MKKHETLLKRWGFKAARLKAARLLWKRHCGQTQCDPQSHNLDCVAMPDQVRHDVGHVIAKESQTTEAIQPKNRLPRHYLSWICLSHRSQYTSTLPLSLFARSFSTLSEFRSLHIRAFRSISLSQTILNRLFGRVLSGLVTLRPSANPLLAMTKCSCFFNKICRLGILAQQDKEFRHAERQIDLCVSASQTKGGMDELFAKQTEKNYSPLTTHFSQKTAPILIFLRRGRKRAFTLAEVFSPHCAGRRKVAFTLAEVLITLGIIGVVAALTLPTLISKHQKDVCVNQLKKSYTTIYNAINMAKSENGDIKSWSYHDVENDAERTNNFVSYIEPYLKYTKIYYYNNGLNKGCKNITYKRMDKKMMACNYDDDNSTASASFCGKCQIGGRNTAVRIDLSDGAIVIIDAYGGQYHVVNFAIDTNGFKGPNTWGKDIFRLSLRDIGGAYSGKDDFILCGGDCHERSFDLLHQCTLTTGYGCAEVIIGDGWKIQDDYPWK